jgi:predicted ATPase
MLTRMRLENFKSWRELDIELAPITVLFGTNSSGKSSVLQALLMLKQTIHSFNPTDINFSGSYINLGSYRDLIFNHDESLPLQIEVEWDRLWFDIGDLDFAGIFFSPTSDEPNKLKHTIRWRNQNDDLVIDAVRYDLYFSNNFDMFIQMTKSQNGQYTFQIPEGFSLSHTRNDEIPENFYSLPYGVYNFDNEKQSFALLSLGLSDNYRRVINSINYLAPLRAYPQRLYLWSGATPNILEPNGENFVAVLIASKRQKTDVLQNVELWLQKVGIADQFDIVALDQRYYETKVSKHGQVASLLDVGFGVSQVLPVITMLFFVPEGSIVLLEQPELHLHPSAQSKLADLFLHVAETRKLQLIIESHSEHLLTRLQRRVAETEYPFATPENIKTYFCRMTEDGSKIESVQIDEYGQIRNYPHNFFGDLSGDLDALTDAALARRREELSRGG